MTLDPKTLLLKGDVDGMLLHHAADLFAKMNDDSLSVQLDISDATVIRNLPSPAEALAAASLIAVLMKAIIKSLYEKSV